MCATGKKGLAPTSKVGAKDTLDYFFFAAAFVAFFVAFFAAGAFAAGAFAAAFVSA